MTFTPPPRSQTPEAPEAQARLPKTPSRTGGHKAGRKRGRSMLATAGVLGLMAAGYMGTQGHQASWVNEALAQDSQGAMVATPYGAAPYSFSKLVKRVRPAVVSIQVSAGSSKSKKRGSNKKRRGGRGENFPDLPDDHPLNEFFKRFGGKGGKGGKGRPRGPLRAQGSGFIISKDGYVVTNHHVVDGAEEIKLTLDDSRKVTAKLIGSDERTDIALLKIEEKGDFPTVPFSKKAADVGDWVLAVGNPFGLGGSVTAGIVSAKGREVGRSPYDYIQIDAAVNRGNSGGPAFNLKGEVVGVNTAIYSPSGGNVGIAFAVTARVTENVVNQLRSSGSVSRGWLGVSIQTVDEDLAAGLGLDDAHGALISKMSAGGPASKSALRVGDAIIGVNGERVADSRDLARKIAELPPKTDTEITVFRDGNEKTFTVTLGRFPSMKKLASLEDAPKSAAKSQKVLGLSLAPAAKVDGAGKHGVAILKVDQNSDAFAKGLRTGTVILKVGPRKVNNPDDVAAGVRKAQKKKLTAILLQIKVADQTRFVAVQLSKK